MMEEPPVASERPKKILVVRLSSLGDLVLMVPMMRALRAGLPSAELHLLCKEKYAGLFEAGGFLDRIVVVRDGGLRELVRLRSWLAMERYDVVIEAHGVIRSRLLTAALNAPRTIRIPKDQLKKLLLIRGKANAYREVTHQAGRYAALARPLGVEVTSDLDALPLGERARAAAAHALAAVANAGAPTVAFAPGARWPTKMWPRERFAALLTEVQRRGFGTIIAGGAEDAAGNAEIARMSPGALDLTGKLSIIESAAVLERCAVLVTNDSAPLHLAEAVGTPVVALFGPTVREFGYFPRLPASRLLERALPCRPCSRNGRRSCPYGTKECLAAITVADALAAVLDVLGKTRSVS
jgi:heptosyltransferase-2